MHTALCLSQSELGSSVNGLNMITDSFFQIQRESIFFLFDTDMFYKRYIGSFDESFFKVFDTGFITQIFFDNSIFECFKQFTFW